LARRLILGGMKEIPLDFNFSFEKNASKRRLMGAFWAFDEKLEKREGNLHKIVKRKLFVYQTTQNYHHNTLVASTKIILIFKMPTFSKNAFLKKKSFVKDNEKSFEIFCFSK
jgi:hypothetical protein